MAVQEEVTDARAKWFVYLDEDGRYLYDYEYEDFDSPDAAHRVLSSGLSKRRARSEWRRLMTVREVLDS